MDVFTRPPSNTYILGSVFSVALERDSITAISFSNSVSTLLLALYAIIVQFLFGALWQLLAAIMLIRFNVNDRLKMVSLVALWNCPDPLSASVKSFQYLLITLKNQHRNWNSIRRALVMVVLSSSTLIAGITIGILYPEWLKIGSFAPVHPVSVYWPSFDTVSDEATVDIFSRSRPGILRALGSAEAGEQNSMIGAVDIQTSLPSDHTPEQPQKQIDYSYKINAENFALQNFADLVMKVSGRCRTDYSWATRRKNLDGYTWDTYYPWGEKDTNQSFSVATELSPSYRMEFVTWLHPDIDKPQQRGNRTFAFLASAALTPSQSHSDDPWYKTQSSNGSEYSLGLPYVVKSRRPVLVCWETTEICVGGQCHDTYLENSPLPAGLAVVFKTRFAHPMMTHVSMAAGVATVKTYVGSASGAYVDAGASSLVGDMTRLILAGYLSSRQIFQEIALAARPSPNSPSILDAAVGRLLDGAKDFVVRTDEAVAMRLDLIIIAPALLALLWLVLGTLKLLKSKDIWTRFSSRAVALSATHLFRQLDEHLSGHPWTETRAAIPEPSVSDSGVAIDISESGMPQGQWDDKGCTGPSIMFIATEQEDNPEVDDLESEFVEEMPGAVQMEAV
jgi:hypothetical protein